MLDSPSCCAWHLRAHAECRKRSTQKIPSNTLDGNEGHQDSSAEADLSTDLTTNVAASGGLAELSMASQLSTACSNEDGAEIERLAEP